MDSLVDAKLQEILGMGSGVKALLFDDETKAILSNLVPHSRLLENDYFLFDSIANRRRARIAGICCVVMIRPDNIKLLVEEISNPFYEQYIVLFTNQVDPLMIEILATSDTQCIVSEVHEIYIDFFRQDRFLYTLCGSRTYTQLHRRRRAVDGLYALILSLGSIPAIRVCGDQGLLEDAEVLGNRLSQTSLAQGGTLIVLDRTFDLYTPLLFEWRYQSLLFEHAAYENGVVRMDRKSYSMADDSFFDVSKFRNIYEVSEDIKDLIRRAEVKKSKLHSLIFDNLEENARISQQVEAHLAQHSHVMRECLRNKDLSEMEMGILQGKVSHSEVSECLLRRDISVRDRSKLLLIYALKNRRDLDSEAKRYPDLADTVERFQERFLNRPQNAPYECRFEGGVDIKLGYQPPLRRVVKHWWMDTLRERHFATVRSAENPKDFVVVYVQNGLTYSEYRALHELQREMGMCRLYVVSDAMVSYKDMLDLHS